MEVKIKDKYLAHFGIPGMRWGIRRKQAGTGSEGSGEHRRTSSNSEDHDRVAALKKKKFSQLSNDEIKTLNARLQLEKQYRDLTPNQKSVGRAALEKVVVDAGTQVATEYANKYMKIGVEKLIAAAVKA